MSIAEKAATTRSRPVRAAQIQRGLYAVKAWTIGCKSWPGNEDAEEEERRILYVAMTRSKDELILTRTCSYYGQRVFYGGAVGDSSPNGTVYFLDTLPDKLVDIRAEGFELDEFAEIQPWGRN